MEPLLKRNEMSLQALCQTQGTTALEKFDFVGSKDGKRHQFFALGTLRVIWASENAQKALAEGRFKDVRYAECKKPGLPDVDAQGRSNWVPSLMTYGGAAPAQVINIVF